MIIRTSYQDIRPSGGAFIIAILASLMLLIASRWEGLLPFSQFLTRIVWPIQYAVDLPTQIKELAAPLLHHDDHLAQINESLQHEQILLQAQVQKLRSLEAENQELRELLKSVSSNRESFSEGRLIRTSVDPFMQQILLNKGKAHGIEIGQPVIDSFGLVGVVTGLNQYTSQVLLVTDPGFAVPIQSVRSGERAIATGSGSGELRLNYVPRTADFIEGDSLVTSGIGGRFPVGYPVGVITSIQHDPSTRFTLVGIDPVAKLDQLRHVLFVKAAPVLAEKNKEEPIVEEPALTKATLSSVPKEEPAPKIEPAVAPVAKVELAPKVEPVIVKSAVKPATKTAKAPVPKIEPVIAKSAVKPAIKTEKVPPVTKVEPVIAKSAIKPEIKKAKKSSKKITETVAISLPEQPTAVALFEPEEMQPQLPEPIPESAPEPVFESAPVVAPVPERVEEVTPEVIHEQPPVVDLTEEAS